MSRGKLATRTGDWDEFRKVADQLKNTNFFRNALEASLRTEAERFRMMVIEGIASGAPGGKTFAPHAPLTTALRAASGFGGSKVLIQTGALMQSVTVKRMGRATYVVGAYRMAPGAANLAALHEFGGTIRVTSKMARFLAVKMKQLGIERTGGGGGGQGVIRIPARPFLRPIVEREYSDIAAARRRFYESLARRMGFAFGDGTGRPVTTGGGSTGGGVPGVARVGNAGIGVIPANPLSGFFGDRGGASRAPYGGGSRDSRGRFVKKG